MSFNQGFFIAQSNSVSTDLYMMRLDGVNESFVVPSYSEIDFLHTQQISSSAWIKLTDYSNGSYQFILDKETSFFTGYRFYVDPAGLLTVQLISSIGAYISIYSTSSPFTNGQLHHIAFTYNGNTDASGLKLYVDGILIATTVGNNTGLNSTLSNGVNLLIGTSSPISNFLAGDLGIIRMWNIELTAADIFVDYNGGVMKNIPLYNTNQVFGWKAGQDASFGTQWVFPEETGNINNPTIYSINMEFSDRISV